MDNIAAVHMRPHMIIAALLATTAFAKSEVVRSPDGRTNIRIESDAGHFSISRGGETVSGERVADTADAVVAALRRIHIPLIRWPGGCFAETYHWRDGIGPRETRPRGVNTAWRVS